MMISAFTVVDVGVPAAGLIMLPINRMEIQQRHTVKIPPRAISHLFDFITSVLDTNDM